MALNYIKALANGQIARLCIVTLRRLLNGLTMEIPPLAKVLHLLIRSQIGAIVCLLEPA